GRPGNAGQGVRRGGLRRLPDLDHSQPSLGCVTRLTGNTVTAEGAQGPVPSSGTATNASPARTTIGTGRSTQPPSPTVALAKKPSSSPSWIATPICSLSPFRPLYQSNHRRPSKVA